MTCQGTSLGVMVYVEQSREMKVSKILGAVAYNPKALALLILSRALM